MTAKTDDLLEQVLDRPDDEPLRLVYADWLQEQGDPRGELVLLQVKKRCTPLSEAEAAREAALIDAHADAWQGKLGRITQFVEFEGGFLHGCSLRELPAWAIGLKEWRTVRHLGVHRDASRLDELLASEPLQRLRSLRVSDASVAVAMSHAPVGLEVLTIDGFHFDPALVFGGARLPQLRQVDARVGTRSLRFERRAVGWQLTVHIGAARWSWKNSVPEVLARLPKGLVSSLVLNVTRELEAAVRKAVAPALVRQA